MVRTAALTFTLLFGLVVPAKAQDAQTLADIRQDLTALYVEVQRLNRELSTTGAPNLPQASGSLIDRVALIEQELQRLTGRTEELVFRVEQVVRDGTNRIGDLEFRLCELEPACDIGSLGDTPSLGGPSPQAPPAAITPAPSPDGPQLAVGEREDFDRARAALDAGDYATAEQLFAAHVETYPGGPLSSEAQLLRGQAIDAQGRDADAARAFLEAFSQAPSGPQAPAALLALGRNLGELGQRQDACITLAEVGARFPGSQEATAAAAEAARLGCG